VTADTDLVALGRSIRAQRLAQGLSQEELADRASLHRNYIGGIERGERNVGIKAIYALARGLGVEVGRLFDPSSTAKSDAS
jgi:transcriptional regulator with XRE-family HTH domain